MSGRIKIAIAGVGNCASSLLQGLHYYRQNPKLSIGLMHHSLGGYHPGDIQAVAAFDMDERKVGKPLEEAIYAPPNCTMKIVPEIGATGVTVQLAPLLDGFSEHMRDYPSDRTFVPAAGQPVDVGAILRQSGADILLNYLPVGSEEAAKYYARCCLETGVSFINCMPVFIVSNPEWAEEFRKAKIPAVGDDIKSQLGATILHRTLAQLFDERGMMIDRTYQLNTGGNTDFLNMLNRSRLRSKKISKTEAVQSSLEKPLPSDEIHIGPSDYVPWQKDNKIAFIRVEGRGFGGYPIVVDLRLSVEDSPNSAGIAIDAIRYCKLARDRHIGGPLFSMCAYAMKHPPEQMPEKKAREEIDQFLETPKN